MFRHVLIDEMQDTNTVQVALVEAIAARRGGQPDGRRRRRAVDLPVPGRQLRQHPQVPRPPPRRPRLPARNELPLDPRDRRLHQRLDRPQRHRASPRRSSRPGRRGSARSSSPPPTPTRRPISSASRSSKTTSRGSRSNRMAVLYRNHYDSIVLQGELVARGINYSVRSGLRFFEQAHIKDVLVLPPDRRQPARRAGLAAAPAAPAGGRPGQGVGALRPPDRRRPTRSPRWRAPR